MNTKLILFFLLLAFRVNSAIPQNNSSPREMFLEAESYFLYEEYNEALPLYLQLSILYPKNDNISYHLGRCYLNIPYEKEKAIGHLEKASKNINPKYKGSSLKETAAPADVIFYLGDAYRVNNQLEKAIAQYRKFKQVSDPEIFDHPMVDDQIRACENALILEKQPLKITYSNLGEKVNSRFAESNAVISGDESTLVYTAQLQFYPAVFYSVMQDGQWSEPLNINSFLGVDDDCFPVGVSYDGKELLLYRNNEYMGDLYVSRLVNGKWSKIKRLNTNINTKYWESHACFSRNGKKLFFTSNRKDSYGGLDIYVSTRSDVSQDNWGTAQNLGPEINSPLNEETPFITADERKIYFSSLGHNGMGGYDIFVSEAGKDGKWSKPKNLGYPLNTTDHDLFFQPVRDGSEGYMALSRNDSYGRNDIYKVAVSAPEAQLATINQKLKEPETIAPSSEIAKNLVKQDSKEELKNESNFINSLANAQPVLASLSKDKNDPISAEKKNNDLKSEETTSGSVATSTSDLKTTEASIQPTVTDNSDKSSSLSAGQKKAWHKLLYGGLGILAVFTFFILLLLRKSRKKEDKQNH